MTEIQVGKVMLTPKGEYDNTKTYTRLDAVTHQGSSYVCLADTSTTPPGDSWQLLADKGATGDVGPQGPKGDTGPVGPQGIQGPVGPAGPKGDTGATGESAYQAWLDAGNTGTEAQFLASLKGPQGPAGPQGDKGDKGDTGATGPQGPKGDTGATGPAGPAGKDGVTPDVSKLVAKTDLANYYTKTETDTKLSTKADQAEYQTLNDKFSNMQIGGRNLVTGTDQDTVVDDTANTGTQGWCLHAFLLTQQPKVGDQITVSAEGTLTGKGDLSAYGAVLYDMNWGDSRSSSVDLTPGKRSSATLTVTSLNGTGDTTLLIYAGRISDTEGKKLVLHHLKVEFGNVATDWTPAPEDLTTAIQKNTTAIGQANQQITDLQTAVKAQQSSAIDTSSQSTNKKPSDYSEGIFHEVKDVSMLGIDRSHIAPELQQGHCALVTTKKYSGYARQVAEVLDSSTPATFVRNGEDSTWYGWLISQLTAY